MSDQLELAVERPLTFLVKNRRGEIIDAFTEDDLGEKTWQEAACWAYIAHRSYEKAAKQAGRVDPPLDASMFD